MSTLPHFDTPGRLRDLDDQRRARWSTEVLEFHTVEVASRFPQYFNPLVENIPDGLEPTPIVWAAFPATFKAQGVPDAERWETADSTRDVQDEYCEWSVQRTADGVIQAITFTTEVPEYWSHIAETDPDTLLALYHDLVSPDVTLTDLLNEQGGYAKANRWNTATDGVLAHLMQPSNTLIAAMRLVSEATIQRHDTQGLRVQDRQELVACGRLGEPLRNSDPQIADVVNDAALTGADLSLADPLGLYLDGIQTAGLRTPDGADAQDFWVIERGTLDHAVRARFEVPPEKDYLVGDIVANGRPITFGGQIADKVRVRISASVRPGTHKTQMEPCA